MKSSILKLLGAILLASWITGCATWKNPNEGEKQPLICTDNYLGNRVSDFCDIFFIGAGISAENEFTGVIPPSLGVYLEATPLLNLGYLQHHGYTIEWEGRGFGAYSESRYLLGFGPYREWKINQGYQRATFYKDEDESAIWQHRMYNNPNGPAKILIHNDEEVNSGYFAYPRGWQAWEYYGIELALCEPFITHLGFTVRLGIDLSEVSDFILGIFTIDFKHDDLRENEIIKTAADTSPEDDVEAIEAEPAAE